MSLNNNKIHTRSKFSLCQATPLLSARIVLTQLCMHIQGFAGREKKAHAKTNHVRRQGSLQDSRQQRVSFDNPKFQHVDDPKKFRSHRLQKQLDEGLTNATIKRDALIKARTEVNVRDVVVTASYEFPHACKHVLNYPG